MPDDVPDEPAVESVPMFGVEPFDPDNPEHTTLIARGVSEHPTEVPDGE